MRLSACHDSILHSRATVLIIGLSSDGTVLAPIVQRLLGLYPCFASHYKDKAHKGELGLGEVLFHTVQKQTTGLSVGSNVGATYIMGVIVQAHPTQTTRPSAWQSALTLIDAKLYELMRYNHVRQIAVLAPKDNEPSLQEASEQFWQILQKLSTPRMLLEVHFDKAVVIDGFVDDRT